MQLADDLRAPAVRLRAAARSGEGPAVTEPLARLESAAAEVGRAWSGSSLGFHARIYHADFEDPSPGTAFSSEWGLNAVLEGTSGDWRLYRHDDVLGFIDDRAGNPDTGAAETLAAEAGVTLDDAREEIISILGRYLGERSDAVVDGLKDEAEKVRVLTATQIATGWLPRGQLVSRDTPALMQGLMIAPHQAALARVLALRSSFGACASLAAIARRAASRIDAV
jgi:hypothetical protein